MNTNNPAYIASTGAGFRLGDIQDIIEATINDNAKSSSYGISATGTTAVTATQLTSVINQVDTVSSNSGVNLPSSSGKRNTPFKSCVIINNGINSLQVYGFPNSTDTINGTGGVTGIAQSAGTTTLYLSAKTGAWFSLSGGGGGSGTLHGANFLINGGVSVIPTGQQPGFFVCPFAGTITGVTLIANASGSCQVDIWKVATGSIPTVANTIVASDPPKLVSQQQSTDTTLTGWTKTISAGDVFAISVTSATTITSLSISLAITGT